MRNYIIALAIIVGAAISGNAQHAKRAKDPADIIVKLCEENFAPWGSDRLTLVAGAEDNGLVYDNIEVEDDMTHVYFSSKWGYHILSLYKGAYVAHTLIAVEASPLAARTKKAKYQRHYLTYADSLVSDKEILATCRGNTYKIISAIDKDSIVRIQIISLAVFRNATDD